MPKRLDSKPCRICGNPVTRKRRTDRKAFYYPRQCDNCFKISRDEQTRRERISKAVQGLSHPRAKPIGTRRLHNARHGLMYWRIKIGHRRHDWCYEHRFVLEKNLGRKLESNEIAHHINGDTLDNRPENLELMAWGHHTKHHIKKILLKGQSIKCLTCNNLMYVKPYESHTKKYCSWNCRYPNPYRTYSA